MAGFLFVLIDTVFFSFGSLWALVSPLGFLVSTRTVNEGILFYGNGILGIVVKWKLIVNSSSELLWWV